LLTRKAHSPGGWAFSLLIAILLVNAFAFRHELSFARVDLNDNVSHFTFIERAVQAVEHHQNPLDFWVPEFAFGYPVFRTYQPLAHLTVAAIYFLLGKTVSLLTVFVWVRYLLLVLLPLSFFCSARLLDLSRPAALAAAMLAPLLVTNGLFGLEAGSFVWAGLGLFPQLFAAHLLLVGMGLAFRAVRTGKRLTLTGAVLGLAFLGHMIYGYIGLLTTVLMAAQTLHEQQAGATGPAVRRALSRLAWIWVTAGLIAGFQLVTMFQDRRIINHSHWEPVWKWDSYGFFAVAGQVLSGAALDYGRLPVLSLLALLGIGAYVWYVWRRKQTESLAAPAETLHFLAGAALLWTLLYCGRPLWGPALLLVGITGSFPIHRFIGAVQIFLIFFGAIGLARLWTWIGPRRIFWSVVATLLILSPAIRERSQYLANTAKWGQQNVEAFAYAEPTLDAAILRAKLRGNRVYSGLGANWGAQWKVGHTPVYAFLGPREVPAVSYLYHSMSLAGDFLVRFDENNPFHYRLFNVSTLLAGENHLPFLKPVATFGRFQLWSWPIDGYFDLIDVPYAVKVDQQTFFDVNDRWLQQTSGAILRQHMALDMQAPVPESIPRLPAAELMPKVQPPLAFGSFRNQRQQGEEYLAEFSAERACYLLFKMTWHPNWQVYVDGVRKASFMVSPGFLGVPVSSGEHRVVCRYEAGFWSLALAVTGLLAVLGMRLVEPRFGNRMGEEASPKLPTPSAA
jgi:hypothetical protein